MCGIAGSTRADPQLLETLCRRLAHRGPDGQGVWLEDGTGLAHTRLAIIDLSPLANQPMVSACGRWVLAFNGEIYNFRELRTELETSGICFRSTSDTEVLLELISRRGTAGLERVCGMFAFALWDRERRELLLARDRLGIKPILYAGLENGGIAFSSEIHALKAHSGIDLSPDGEAISEYLACLYVPAPRTAYRGIRKLPPGHVLRWRDGMTMIERYWQPHFGGRQMMSVDEAAEEILPALKASVAGHMIADVPVGCFLSGGIDSSVIAALMAEEARRAGAPPIRTFTLTFAEPAYDEREAASEVAAHIGSIHTELPASPTKVGDQLTRLVRTFGEPFGNPTALLIDDLSAKAREHVTVALVGDGGDEVFAGYPRYRGGVLAEQYRYIPKWLRGNVLQPLVRQFPERADGRHAVRRIREFVAGADLPDNLMYASWVEYFSPAERAALLGSPNQPQRPIATMYAETGLADPLDAMQQTDLASFLPGNILAYGDAMSMAHGLELRLPLLDHRLINRVADFAPKLRIRNGLKTILRAIAARLLPPSTLRRPKRGLNPPMGLWLKGELSELVENRLSRRRLDAIGLAATPIKHLIEEHRAGRRDHALKIWSLLVLEAWMSA